MIKWVFVYGSLIDPEEMKRTVRIDRALIRKKAKIKGYKLAINKWSICRNSLVLGLEEGKECEGFAYKVPEKYLICIDQREGYRRDKSSGYLREEVPILLIDGNQEVNGCVYVTNKNSINYRKTPKVSEITDKAYLRNFLSIARKENLNVPEDIIKLVHKALDVSEYTAEMTEKLYERYIYDVARPLCRMTFLKSNSRKKEWNDRTHQFFFQQGMKRGYSVYTNREQIKKLQPDLYTEWKRYYGEAPKEYLVDLCWRKWEEKKYRMDLAVEIEWKPIRPSDYTDGLKGEKIIDEDLYKLLDVQARWKLGILGCSLRAKNVMRQEDIEGVVQIFSTYVSQRIEIPSDYLLIFVDMFGGKDSGIRGFCINGHGSIVEFPNYTFKKLGS